MRIEKFFTLLKVDLVPVSRNSVLLLFSLRKFDVNQDFISLKGSRLGRKVEVCCWVYWRCRAGCHPHSNENGCCVS